MPTARTARPFLASGLAAILCLGWLPPAVSAADEPAVIAVIAVDPYAELKQQARWVGAQIDQPTLDGFLESFIMIGTQFKGLAGLDVTRPAGVVVTAEGPAGVPVPRGFVPVKDLGKLLEALQGIIGPAQEQDGVRTISPAGMPPIQIVERNGWAIFATQGSPDAPTGLEKALDGVVESFSLGVQAFPARMPDGMRKRFEAALQQAAMQAQQGQPVDADALEAGLRNLAEVETILLGANVDIDKERVFVENRFAMVPGSAAGGLYGDMAKAVLSTPAAATADGKPAAVSGHIAMAVPESLRGVVKDALARALPDPAPMVFELLRAVVPAMLDAGGLDAALTIDTAAAEMTEGKALPAVTVGMKVKDGRALEADLKAAFGAAGALPQGVTANFDAGKAGAANLHVVEVDLADIAAERILVGDKLTMTLAVAPTHAFLLCGGDMEKRIAAATAGAAAKPDAKPVAGLDVSLASLTAYSAAAVKLMAPENAAGIAVASATAEEAGVLPSSLVQLLVRPIERGMATRLSADGGAIKVMKMAFEISSAAMIPQPADFGPDPEPNGRPIPLPGLAP